MTTDQYINNLDKTVKKMEDITKFQECFLNALDSMDERIFGRGDIEGTEGRFSYKSKSYKKFRAKKGRQTRYIDLQLTGDFRLDTGKMERVGESYVVRVSRGVNIDKLTSFRDRWARAFTHTEKEIEKLTECIAKKTKKLIENG